MEKAVFLVASVAPSRVGGADSKKIGKFENDILLLDNNVTKVACAFVEKNHQTNC
jgi:hypothetical protein